MNVQWNVCSVTPGLDLYTSLKQQQQQQQCIYMVRFQQRINPHLALVLSKCSAAVCPGHPTSDDVHRGEEATFQQILGVQPGVRMMCNGAFHHFATDKYLFPHSDKYGKGDNVYDSIYRGWHVGMPCEHIYTDMKYRFGHLIQQEAGHPFHICNKNGTHENASATPLYKLTGSPMLVHQSVGVQLDDVLTEEEETQSKHSVSDDAHVLPPGNLQHMRVRNPRTMIAETMHGDLLFIVVDGPQKKAQDEENTSKQDSLGMTMHEQVEFLLSLEGELKVKHALNLDGGGSSTLFLHTKDHGGRILNKPSTPDRAIGNVLILFDATLTSLSNVHPKHSEQICKAHQKHLTGFASFVD